jgi:hypothetical protein
VQTRIQQKDTKGTKLQKRFHKLKLVERVSTLVLAGATRIQQKDTKGTKFQNRFHELKLVDQVSTIVLAGAKQNSTEGHAQNEV